MDFLQLIHFVSSDPNCQSFDRYIIVSEGSDFAEIFNTAVDELYQFYTGVFTSGDFRKVVCDPAGYDIVIGPVLGETL